MSKFAELLQTSQAVDEQKKQKKEAQRQKELRIKERKNAITEQFKTIYDDIAKDFIEGFKAFLGLEPDSDQVQYQCTYDESNVKREASKVCSFSGFDERTFATARLVITLDLNGKQIWRDGRLSLKKVDREAICNVWYEGQVLSSLYYDYKSVNLNIRQDNDWQLAFEKLFAEFKAQLQ